MLATLLGNLPGMVYRCRNDRGWTMEFVSEGARELTGYLPAELVGSARASYGQLIHRDDRDRVWSEVQVALVERRPFEFRYRILAADGSEKWVWERGRGVFAADGQLEALEGFITDITELKRAELGSGESGRLLSLAFNCARDMMLLASVEPGPDFRVQLVNDEYIRIVRTAGYDVRHADFIGRSFEHVRGIFNYSEKEWKMILSRFRQVVESRQAIRFEQTTETPRGIFYGDTMITPVCDAAGVCTMVLYSSSDTTAQVRTRQAFRESEEKFAAAFRASPEAMAISELESGLFIDVNDSFERIIGFSRDEVVGRTSYEIGMWQRPDDRMKLLKGLEKDGSVQRQEIGYFARGQRAFTGLCSCNIIEVGGVRCILSSIEDITSRIEAERALRESEKKFATAFRSSPYALSISELATGRYVDVNVSYERLSGYRRDEVIGRTSFELNIWCDSNDRDELVRRIKKDGVVRQMEIKFFDRNRKVLVTRCSCELVDVAGKSCLLNAIEDITEQRRNEEAHAALEQQLRQTQKLEALGQLAGGIAHDFNNILTGVIAYAELAKMDADDPVATRSHLVQVSKAGERAKELVRQILTFSRQQKQERKATRLDHAVNEAVSLIRSTLPATIAIDTQISPAAPVVLADPTQIHQVMMNLCTNAGHAMGRRTGRLTIKLESVELDQESAQAAPGLRPGLFARLTVADTGQGMDQETLKRIFEPFFTTRRPGEGTGLGLSVVHGIVEEHDGVITVQSRPHAGTVFQIFFPAHVVALTDEAITGVGLPRGTGQQILFIDDEQMICDSSKVLLDRIGYSTTAHVDARGALAEFSTQPAAFDLVITDLTMPHLTGLDVARRILAIRPELPILLTSGFTGGWTQEGVRAIGLSGLINKPFTPSRLATMVAQALAQATKAS